MDVVCATRRQPDADVERVGSRRTARHVRRRATVRPAERLDTIDDRRGPVRRDEAGCTVGEHVEGCGRRSCRPCQRAQPATRWVATPPTSGTPNRPSADDALWSDRRVLVTPHVAGIDRCDIPGDLRTSSGSGHRDPRRALRRIRDGSTARPTTSPSEPRSHTLMLSLASVADRSPLSHQLDDSGYSSSAQAVGVGASDLDVDWDADRGPWMAERQRCRSLIVSPGPCACRKPVRRC